MTGKFPLRYDATLVCGVNISISLANIDPRQRIIENPNEIYIDPITAWGVLRKKGDVSQFPEGYSWVSLIISPFIFSR